MVGGSDTALECLSKSVDQLSEGFLPAFPPWDVVSKVRRKRITYAIASELGIGVPSTEYVTSPDEMHQVLENWDPDLYPLLLKPEDSKRFLAEYGRKGIVCHTPDEARESYSRYQGFYGDLLVQEMIPGDVERLVNVLAVREPASRRQISFVNRKLRSCGPLMRCTLMKSDRSSEAVEATQRLLEEIGYFGFANAEFKEDARDQRLKLMEINGRLTISNSHSLRCGLNLVLHAYESALGAKWGAELLEGRPGLEDILWWEPLGDLIGLVRSACRRELRPWRVLRQTMGRGYAIEPFALRDPVPSLYHMSQLARSLVSRR